MSPNEPLVRVRNLRKRFLHEGREVEILKGIDLEVMAGEMLAVVGASGAGKSTLLYLLGTLDLPTAGTIEYDGEDVTRYTSSRLAAFRNQRLGFVFQFHHLLPEFSALENVMMPGLIRGMARPEIERTARDLLEEVGLTPRLTHRPAGPGVVHAFSDHAKANAVFTPPPCVPLREGLCRMADWARTLELAPAKRFEALEIFEKLPSGWQAAAVAGGGQ